jgi:hypothetical protein
MNTLHEPPTSSSSEVPSILPSGTPGPPVEPLGLRQDPAKIVEELKVQRDTTIFRLLMSARSAQEFRSLRSELFQKYVYLSGAISNVVKSDIDPRDLEELLSSAYAGLEEQIRSDAVLFDGQEEARSDALYSVDALHRAQALFCQIVESLSGTRLEESLQRYDAQLNFEAVSYLWFALLHLQAIMFAIDAKLMPSAEVLKELLAGLRTSTRAYAVVRETWGLRFDHTFNEIDLSTALPDSESGYLAQQSECEYLHFLKSNPSQRP